MIHSTHSMSIFIVIPTNRNLEFLKEWKRQFINCNLLIVEDHELKEIDPPQNLYKKIYHYTWKDIHHDFGKNEWIFSRKNAGIRSYGFWKAYMLGADIIITLDDDCYPVDNDFVTQHINNLNSYAPEAWFSTFPHPDFNFTRGFPYKIRHKYETVISHGLWSNKMDLDAQTQLKHVHINMPPYQPIRQFIPKRYYFPMSSMNLAFSRKVVPLMYFPLMGFNPEGKSWQYNRFDDIWAGIFIKKICDHLGLAIVTGSPFVEHRKASNLKENLIKEKAGLAVNEYLWKQVDAVVMSDKTPSKCYIELANKINFTKETYFEKLRGAMIIWGNLFT